MSAQLSKSETGSTVRTFLAVDLPQALKISLGSVRSGFADHDSMLKWTAPDLLHITVRFLGSVPGSWLSEVEGAAHMAASQAHPFSLHLSGLGAFPNERSPRVIWIGLAHDQGYADLERLFSRAEEGLASRGFAPEPRGFSPHITLARCRDGASPADTRSIGERLQQVKKSHPVSGSWKVEELIVMRSDLSSAGPRYTPLATYPLGSKHRNEGVR